MKNVLLALVAASGLIACKKEPQGDLGLMQTPINQTFILDYKQTALLLRPDASPVKVTLTEVQDSRCPANAFCFWAGYAAVTVELTDATTKPQTARLSLLNKPSPAYSLDSVAVTLNQQPYWLRLVAVSPYPSTTTGNQPQLATLRLRPR